MKIIIANRRKLSLYIILENNGNNNHHHMKKMLNYAVNNNKKCFDKCKQTCGKLKFEKPQKLKNRNVKP